jgi:hypothetical protein
MGGELTDEMRAHLARSIDRLWSQLAAGLRTRGRRLCSRRGSPNAGAVRAVA